MRKPTQHYIFNLPNNEGLSSLLLNWSTYQDSIISTEIEDLDVLTSGPIPPNPSELITSRAFANLYDTLLMNYNFVIIDTPSSEHSYRCAIIFKVYRQCCLRS